MLNNLWFRTRRSRFSPAISTLADFEISVEHFSRWA